MARIALLSNITIDIVKDYVKKYVDVCCTTGFDTWQMEVLNEKSNIYADDITAIYLILHVDFFESLGTVEEKIYSWLNSIEMLVKNANGVPVFISSLDIWHRECATYSQMNCAHKLHDIFNNAILDMNKNRKEVYFLPVAEQIHNVGRESFYSEKMWYAGNIPYSMRGIKEISKLIVDSYTSIKGKRKKCIAVDLDGTLWGGVVGEEGWDGIILSDHKEGQRFQNLQKLLKQMKEQGVILVILSKNNEDDVKQVFEKNPYMILSLDDFVCSAINWEPKYSNLKKIVNKLNIGLDSVVFLDDNPVEREQMRQMCPEVEIVDFPADSSMLPTIMEKVYVEQFKCLCITEEDGKKTQMYHSAIDRAEVLEKSETLDDYLGKLEIEVDIHEMKKEEMKRVVQLLNKTNQFNTTTKRYTELEVSNLVAKNHIIVASMKDKFGDEGLVSVVILVVDGSVVEIDSFIMSCRVMGRKFENVIMDKTITWIKNNNPQITKVVAKYIATNKNVPVKMLYDNMGFECINESKDQKEYCINIDEVKCEKINYKKIVAFEE